MHTRLYDLYHGILYIKHQTGTSLRRFGTRATGCRIKIIPVTILVQACGGARKTRVLESFLTVPLRSQSTVHSRRALVIQALRIPASGRLCPRSSIVEHGNHNDLIEQNGFYAKLINKQRNKNKEKLNVDQLIDDIRNVS